MISDAPGTAGLLSIVTFLNLTMPGLLMAPPDIEVPAVIFTSTNSTCAELPISKTLDPLPVMLILVPSDLMTRFLSSSKGDEPILIVWLESSPANLIVSPVPAQEMAAGKLPKPVPEVWLTVN